MNGLIYVLRLRWEVVVRFVDIGSIVDRDCLSFLLITMFWRHIETNLIKMRQKVIGNNKNMEVDVIKCIIS